MIRISGANGFTYVGLLIAMTIISIMTSVVGPSWRAASRAEKEKELLWRGHQFRNAIGLYSRGYPVPAGHPAPYPAELKDLLKDPRSAGVRRYLRQIYTDPMTGKDDWVLVLGDNGRIMGVHSASDAEPLKKDNFDLVDSEFRGKTKYSEWIFQYKPGAPGQPLLVPGQPPVTPAQPPASPHG